MRGHGAGFAPRIRQRQLACVAAGRCHRPGGAEVRLAVVAGDGEAGVQGGVDKQKPCGERHDRNCGEDKGCEEEAEPVHA